MSFKCSHFFVECYQARQRNCGSCFHSFYNYNLSFFPIEKVEEFNETTPVELKLNTNQLISVQDITDGKSVTESHLLTIRLLLSWPRSMCRNSHNLVYLFLVYHWMVR